MTYNQVIRVPEQGRARHTKVKGSQDVHHLPQNLPYAAKRSKVDRCWVQLAGRIMNIRALDPGGFYTILSDHLPECRVQVSRSNLDVRRTIPTVDIA